MAHQAVSVTTGHFGIPELISLLWSRRLLLSICVALAAVSSVVYSVQKPNVYESRALLVSTDDSGSSVLSNVASQLGSLGGLTGSIFGQGRVGRSVISMEILRSWNFAEAFIEKHDLEADIWASVDWDESSDEIVYDESAYDPRTGEWATNDKGESVRPTSWDLFKKYKEGLSVSQDDDTGLIRVGFEHHSPRVSKKIVELLVVEVNSEIQETDAAVAGENIRFLDAQMNKTPNAEMQQVIARLIESQMKTLMLASGTREYALKTVTPPKTPEEKKRPKRALICIFGTIAGFLAGVLFVLGQAFWPRRNS